MIYLSAKIEYGINFLVYLAKRKNQTALRQVAADEKMPYRFLNKISRELIRGGLIQSKEGRGGGYSLSKKPGQINLRAILDVLGEPLSIAQCFSGKDCPLGLVNECKMRKVWGGIKKNIERELGKTTLKDIL